MTAALQIIEPEHILTVKIVPWFWSSMALLCLNVGNVLAFLFGKNDIIELFVDGVVYGAGEGRADTRLFKRSWIRGNLIL